MFVDDAKEADKLLVEENLAKEDNKIMNSEYKLGVHSSMCIVAATLLMFRVTVYTSHSTIHLYF